MIHKDIEDIEHHANLIHAAIYAYKFIHFKQYTVDLRNMHLMCLVDADAARDAYIENEKLNLEARELLK